MILPNGGIIRNKVIISPNELSMMSKCRIIIISLSGMRTISKQLAEMGIEKNWIDTSFVEIETRGRETFVRNFAEIVDKVGMDGNVAEAGVFQGEFASVINDVFPTKKLYLFDTFEGFDKRDVEIEHEKAYSNAKIGHLNITSEELVLGKMKNPETCMLRKGYIPESFCGLEKEKFCYVNLDMDLYKPTCEGLLFFYPRMVTGGIITIHDYFSTGYKGINAAVEEFVKRENIVPFPMGDGVSICIQK